MDNFNVFEIFSGCFIFFALLIPWAYEEALFPQISLGLSKFSSIDLYLKAEK
jgi:hypothetical protein